MSAPQKVNGQSTNNWKFEGLEQKVATGQIKAPVFDEQGDYLGEGVFNVTIAATSKDELIQLMGSVSDLFKESLKTLISTYWKPATLELQLEPEQERLVETQKDKPTPITHKANSIDSIITKVTNLIKQTFLWGSALARSQDHFEEGPTELEERVKRDETMREEDLSQRFGGDTPPEFSHVHSHAHPVKQDVPAPSEGLAQKKPTISGRLSTVSITSAQSAPQTQGMPIASYKPLQSIQVPELISQTAVAPASSKPLKQSIPLQQQIPAPVTAEPIQRPRDSKITPVLDKYDQLFDIFSKNPAEKDVWKAIKQTLNKSAPTMKDVFNYLENLIMYRSLESDHINVLARLRSSLKSLYNNEQQLRGEDPKQSYLDRRSKFTGLLVSDKKRLKEIDDANDAMKHLLVTLDSQLLNPNMRRMNSDLVKGLKPSELTSIKDELVAFNEQLDLVLTGQITLESEYDSVLLAIRSNLKRHKDEAEKAGGLIKIERLLISIEDKLKLLIPGRMKLDEARKQKFDVALEKGYKGFAELEGKAKADIQKSLPMDHFFYEIYKSDEFQKAIEELNRDLVNKPGIEQVRIVNGFIEKTMSSSGTTAWLISKFPQGHKPQLDDAEIIQLVIIILMKARISPDIVLLPQEEVDKEAVANLRIPNTFGKIQQSFQLIEEYSR